MEEEKTPKSGEIVNRETIKEQRILRREEKKRERELEKYQKQVAEKRNPKSRNVQLIDSKTFEKYKNSQAGPSSSNEERKNISKPKKPHGIITLADFIQREEAKEVQVKKVKPVTVKINKGKRNEFSVKKQKTKLKKAIICIREKRRKELENKVEIVVKENNENDSKIKFSRKFRPYCDHMLDENLLNLGEEILKDLFRFQSRAYDKNEIKARAHKRFVVGFKEVKRQLELKKTKLIFIAPDLEPSPGEGGLDELVEKLIKRCKERKTIYSFPLQRRKLAYCLFKKTPIGCVGVLDYSGIEEKVQCFVDILNVQRSIFQKEIQ